MSDPHTADPQTKPGRTREQRAVAAAVVLGVVLTVVKFAAWRLTGSSAVYSDAVESIVNIAASVFALWALRQAHRPADRTHPYGHGRFEFLSASAEGALIAAAAVSIVWESAHRMLAGDTGVERIGLGIGLVGATVLANGAMGWRLIALGRSSKSATLESDGKHLLTDAITGLGAIVALGLVHLTGNAWIDPIVALVMAAVILVVGYRIVRAAFGNLLAEQDAGDYEPVRAILDAHVAAPGRAPRAPAISGWHKLRTRHVGRHHWVDFHVQVPGTMDVRSAHELATAIELEIEAALSHGEDGGNATAHVEPAE